MDNGHQHQGAISSNLDEKDWQRSLEISAPANMPTPETLQEKANDFFTPENTVGNFSDTPENETLESQSSEAPANPNELGQIISTTIPSTTSVPENRSFNTANIRTAGDHLEKSTIPEIDNAINELNQTGNLNNFYDEIRGEGSMLDANLSNSFNRKLGQDQLGGGKA